MVLHSAVELCVERKPGGVAVAFYFERLVDPWAGEGSIASEELAHCLVPITVGYRLQD